MRERRREEDMLGREESSVGASSLSWLELASDASSRESRAILLEVGRLLDAIRISDSLPLSSFSVFLPPPILCPGFIKLSLSSCISDGSPYQLDSVYFVKS